MKNLSGTGVSRLLDLACILEKDIKNRNLKAGDSYLTTAETASFLEIGTKTANEVLQILEKKGVLHRAQRRGAVITKSYSSNDLNMKSKIDSIYFLFGRNTGYSQEYLPEFFTQEEECSLTISLQKKLKKVNIIIKGLTPTQEYPEVSELVSEALQTDKIVGFVCLGCPPEIQRLLGKAGFPAVIWGTCHRSIEGISSLESDFESAASLCAALIHRKNHERVAFFTHNMIYPGVHVFLDSFRRQLGTKLVCERFLPVDSEVIAANVREVFQMNHPDVWYIKYSNPELIINAIDELKRQTPDYKPDIIYEARYAAYKVKVPSPCYIVTMEIDASTLGRMLGNMLLGSLRKEAPQHLLLPIQLQVQE